MKTTKQKNLTLLDAICNVVEKSRNTKLSNSFLTKCKQEIAIVSQTMNLTPIQAVLFCIFIDHCDDDQIRPTEISRHLDCSNSSFIKYLNDIDTLKAKKLIKKSENRLFRKNDSRYCIPQQVINCLKENKGYEPDDYKCKNFKDFFETLEHIFDMQETNEFEENELFAEIKKAFENNGNLAFVKKFNAYKLNDNNAMLLLFMAHLLYRDDNNSIVANEFKELFPIVEYKKLRGSLESGKNELIKKKLINFNISEGFEDRYNYRITDATKEELLSELNLSVEEIDYDKQLKKCTEIEKKKLYFNPKEQEQLNQLSDLLKKENFCAVQKKLEENGMRKGFACLFYGTPGTGKTESVLQIARMTGRDIMQVNISQIKSMWVGESEKNIKQVFDKYRKYVKKMNIAPILLFNEADAVIGTRKQNAKKAVDKMENAIQNIILEEMENLDGILIATTNLSQNLDTAFERRFLYKIKYEKPQPTARKSIWKTMISGMKNKDADTLSTSYDFSGGEIENIARKCTIDSILSGKKPTIENIKEICDQERLCNKKKRIIVGF